VILNNLSQKEFDETNNFVKQIKINNEVSNNYPFFTHSDFKCSEDNQTITLEFSN